MYGLCKYVACVRWEWINPIVNGIYFSTQMQDHLVEDLLPCVNLKLACKQGG